MGFLRYRWPFRAAQNGVALRTGKRFGKAAATAVVPVSLMISPAATDPEEQPDERERNERERPAESARIAQRDRRFQRAQFTGLCLAEDI
jgi:hypothetical protein